MFQFISGVVVKYIGLDVYKSSIDFSEFLSLQLLLLLLLCQCHCHY